MLSAVFRTILPEISTSLIIRDLLWSFQVEAPGRSIKPPSWDLVKVLEYLRSPVFEPLSSTSLRNLTCKTLFLVALAMAKRVGQLQALSRIVSFSSSSAGLSYVPEVLAKTETAVRPLPRTSRSSLLGILWPACRKIFYCVQSALFLNILRGLPTLSTALVDCLCLLVVLHGLCPGMVFRISYVR